MGFYVWFGSVWVSEEMREKKTKFVINNNKSEVEMLPRVTPENTFRSGGPHQPLGRFQPVNARFDCFNPALPDSDPGEF